MHFDSRFSLDFLYFRVGFTKFLEMLSRITCENRSFRKSTWINLTTVMSFSRYHFLWVQCNWKISNYDSKVCLNVLYIFIYFSVLFQQGKVNETIFKMYQYLQKYLSVLIFTKTYEYMTPFHSVKETLR